MGVVCDAYLRVNLCITLLIRQHKPYIATTWSLYHINTQSSIGLVTNTYTMPIPILNNIAPSATTATMLSVLPLLPCCYCSPLLLKSIRVHLDPGSQLVCVLTQTLVIVTTARIFVANLRV